MLMPMPLSWLSYNYLGKIVPERPEIEGTIKALCLNNETLEEIRMLWYKISRSDKTVADILAITHILDKISLLKELFHTDNYTTLDDWKKYAPVPPPGHPHTTNHETPYWDLFIKYDWFYHYYKAHTA